jgi:cytochrome c
MPPHSRRLSDAEIARLVNWVLSRTGSPPTETASPLEALAKKSGCLECHSVEKKLIGPSFRDIAAKYKADERARETLIDKVKKGGKGNWTDITHGVPMPPHSRRLSDAEIARLVNWVLGR